jgi:hypothetical protein
MGLDRRHLESDRHRLRMSSSYHRSRPMPLADRTRSKTVWTYRYQEVVEGGTFDKVADLVQSDFLRIHERHGVLARKRG